MKRKMIYSAMLLSAVATLSACDVDQTEEGELPDVDVSMEGGNMPEYDVDTADVSVESKEVEMEVPDVDVDVDTKTETISVPDVNVDMPEDDDVND
ncbi:hypothetical protein [Pseudomaricurvus sp.]|uniref:hypothetical protein n=1 Tax=Pseudomaricurvus sp. TaxID=2004510 RepID=UPI003F6D1DCB